MTEHRNGFFVTLEPDISDDGIEPLLNAVLCLKGVLSVRRALVEYVSSEVSSSNNYLYLCSCLDCPDLEALSEMTENSSPISYEEMKKYCIGLVQWTPNRNKVL